MAKTIVIVDDEIKIIEVVQSYLENKGYQVLSATTGAETLSLLKTESVDLLLLDIMLPDMTGFDICTQIRQTSTIPIIMLTARIEEEDMLRGLNLGADDYITKPFSLKTLLARIEAVLRRTSNTPEPLQNILSFGQGDLEIDLSAHMVKKKNKPIHLTANEFQILATFAKYPSRVFTRNELIEVAFGYDYEAYNRTIDSHIKNIRSKIEDNSKDPIYIKTVYGVGYQFGGDTC